MPFAVENVVEAAKSAARGQRPASFIYLNAFPVAPDDTWLQAPNRSRLESGLVDDAGDIFRHFSYEVIGHITRLVVRRRDWISSPFIVAGPHMVWGVINHLLTMSRGRPAYFVRGPLVGARKKHSQASFENHVALAYCIELPSYDLRLLNEWNVPRRDVARAQGGRWRRTLRGLVKVNLFEEYAPYWPIVDCTPLLTIGGRMTRSVVRLALRKRPWSMAIRGHFERKMATPIRADRGLHDLV